MGYTPWAIALALYVLGGVIVFEDLRAADKEEQALGWQPYDRLSYAACTILWPFLVLLVLASVIFDKIKGTKP
jgi:hypothetical protein